MVVGLVVAICDLGFGGWFLVFQFFVPMVVAVVEAV